MKNKIKERMERILHGSILFTTLLTLAFPVQAWAKVGGNETEYTYTVTLALEIRDIFQIRMELQ